MLMPTKSRALLVKKEGFSCGGRTRLLNSRRMTASLQLISRASFKSPARDRLAGLLSLLALVILRRLVRVLHGEKRLSARIATMFLRDLWEDHHQRLCLMPRRQKKPSDFMVQRVLYLRFPRARYRNIYLRCRQKTVTINPSSISLAAFNTPFKAAPEEGPFKGV